MERFDGREAWMKGLVRLDIIFQEDTPRKWFANCDDRFQRLMRYCDDRASEYLDWESESAGKARCSYRFDSNHGAAEAVVR